MNRTIFSLLALAIFALPAGAADAAKTEGGLQPKDGSSTAPLGVGQSSSSPPGSPSTSAAPKSAPDLSSPAGVMTGTPDAVPLRGAAETQLPSSQAINADAQVAPAQIPGAAGTANFQAVSPAGATGARQLKQLSANYSTVSATAKMLREPPLMRCRDENIQFVEITLRNDSPEVALVHGDIAEAKVGNSMRTAASARYIGTVSSPKLDTKGRIYTGLAFAGSWGLAAPILYENFTPDQHAKRYKGTAIGVDGSRHEIEDQRFGLRVLMPGEETVGWLAFECPTASDLTSLLIPVNYSKSQLPSGSLLVKVSPAESGATVSTTSTQSTSVKTTTPGASTTSAATGVVTPVTQGASSSRIAPAVTQPATSAPLMPVAPTPSLR